MVKSCAVGIQTFKLTAPLYCAAELENASSIRKNAVDLADPIVAHDTRALPAALRPAVDRLRPAKVQLLKFAEQAKRYNSRHARDAGSMVKEAPQDVSPTLPPSISPPAGFKVEDDKDVNPAISSMLGSKVEDDYDLFDVDGPIFQILAGIIAIVTIPIFLGVQGCRAIRMKMRNKDHEETGNPEVASKQLESQVARTDSPENSVYPSQSFR